MFKKKNYLFFTIFILNLLIFNKAISAPLCLEEEENIGKNLNLENKEETNEVNNVTEDKTVNLDGEKKEDNDKEDEKQEDIEISADNKIEVDNQKGVMIVTGNALVKEGLTSLKADMLTAFTCEAKNGDTKILQINADNNVLITSDQGKAFADRGIYFVEDQVIELYDNVKLEKEGDILFGDKGIFNVTTGKGEISIEPNKAGGKRKVYGIIKSKKK